MLLRTQQVKERRGLRVDLAAPPGGKSIFAGAVWSRAERRIRAPPVAERGSPAAGALGRLTYELLPRIELTLNMIDIRADAN